jgi:hypothetical protein
MRLMIGVFVVTLLVIIDHARYHGQYTAAALRVIKHTLSSFGF